MKNFTFMQNNKFLYVILLILSIPLLLPYIHFGFFPSHDGEWAVVRLTDMYREIKDLQFPPRYSGNLDFGYGYPLFNFAYPFPYYLSFLFHILKFNFVDSIKLLFAITVPLSGVFMYKCALYLWKNKYAAFFSALLYIYLPYRLVDLFVRGSIGESIAFALYPMLFYAIFGYLQSKKRIYGIFFSILLAILVTTHNIMAVYFIPFIIGFYIYLYFTNKKELVSFTLYILLGICLSTFFWLPALYEKQYIQLSVIPIADRTINFVTPYQLIIPKIGYGVPNLPDGFSYQIGFAQLLLFILIIVFLLRSLFSKKQKQIKNFTFISIFSIIAVFYTSLLFSPSNFFWEHAPLFKEINYPWTLLLPIGFLICLLTGYIYSFSKYTAYTIAILSIVTVFFYLPYANPVSYVNRGDFYYLTNDATTTSSSEYTPLWVKEKPLKRPDIKVYSLTKNTTFSNIVFNSKKISFDSYAQESSTIIINTIYYPGWHLIIDGVETHIGIVNPQGTMSIIIPSGTHHIMGIFKETPLRLFSDIISLVAVIITVVCLAFFLLRSKNDK